MNTKAETGPDTLDTAKLVVAALVLLGGIVAYYWLADSSLLLRVLALVVGLVLGLFVAFQSAQGQQLWQFIQGSQVEIRKVVWPNQQETMQTTLLVLVFAAALGVFFLLIDWVLLGVTQFVTGQGG
jgi:preprotein translocase subunit SecE